MTRPTTDLFASGVSDSLTPSPAGWLMVGVLGIVILVSTMGRVVPEHQRLVVTRLGRVVRVDGPGLAWRIAGVERWTLVSLRPEHQLLGIAATTVDGVSVHVRVTAQCHVTDPMRSVIAAEDPMAATYAEVEAQLAREVAGTRFADLLAMRRQVESDLPTLVTGATSAWGVEVISVDIGDIEVLLTADLMHSLPGSAERE